MPTNDEAVKNPTWITDIRFLFRPEDIDHMGQRGIDLATYEGVKANAIRVFGATEPPDATMPPDPAAKWSQARWETFKNWIVNDFPFGTAVPQSRLAADATARRVRRNAASLDVESINKIKAAFQGLMARPAEDPKSYFAQAAVHWLPAPLSCLHHENRYNPWHRAYLHPFENALRSVPGCEDVTLPYWDITSPVPDFLYQPPFADYTLPRDIGGGFSAGYVTRRNPAAEVMSNIQEYGIPGQIADAMTKTVWSQFNTSIILPHDNGHGAIGETMIQQDVAAYDPIFWFFHANLDRLWWKWQQGINATTLTGLLSTVTGSTNWLRMAPFNSLPPFSETADQTIDLTTYGTDYEHPAGEPPAFFVAESFGSLPAQALSRLHSLPKASVRVKGIDRLNIPGSFTVHLKAGGETVAKQMFFQSRNPRACSACVKQGKVNIDLKVDVDRLRGESLRVVIEPMWPGAIGTNFPLSTAGDPTVNMRLLLE